MAFCSKCGAQMEEGAKFCSSCGAEAPQASSTQQAGFRPTATSISSAADITGEMDPQDIAQNKVISILAYLGFLVLVPIFGAKNSKFARFHANQGLILFLAEIIWQIVIRILSAVISGVISLTPLWVFSFVPSLLNLTNLLFFIPMIMGIINVTNGQAKELPLIGKLKILH